LFQAECILSYMIDIASLSITRNRGLFDKELTAKLTGLQFERAMVFEPSEFDCIFN
jgi:hypothetical protein